MLGPSACEGLSLELGAMHHFWPWQHLATHNLQRYVWEPLHAETGGQQLGRMRLR